jgi:exodeoxyribonuclease VII large subunit
MRFDALCHARDAALSAHLERAGQQFSLAAAALDAMSPLRVLERGYAIAQDASGGIVREAKTVSVGDALRLRLWKGTLDCRVEAVTEPGAVATGSRTQPE